MNPYQVMGIIACCTIVFAGVVTLLTMQGVHILLAFLVVYLVAVWCMLGMQRRARESYEVREEFRSRRHESEPLTDRVRANDFQGPARTGTKERTGGNRVEQLRV
jgi:Na+-transporting methylmalonyl-CoA/oxaloacetate decarboxylase gamma subunit